MVRSAGEQDEFTGFLVGFWGWLVVGIVGEGGERPKPREAAAAAAAAGVMSHPVSIIQTK